MSQESLQVFHCTLHPAKWEDVWVWCFRHVPARACYRLPPAACADGFSRADIGAFRLPLSHPKSLKPDFQTGCTPESGSSPETFIMYKCKMTHFSLISLLFSPIVNSQHHHFRLVIRFASPQKSMCRQYFRRLFEWLNLFAEGQVRPNTCLLWLCDARKPKRGEEWRSPGL